MIAPRKLICLLALATLAGCYTLPTYVPKPDEKTTEVVLLGYGKPNMCYQGGRYQLATEDLPDHKSRVLVPTGARITLWRFMSYQGYQVISTCNPTLSFIPRENIRYFVNSGLNGNRCFIEAVREDTSRESGIAPELTLGHPSC